MALQWSTDRRLQVRMVLSLGLLFVLPVAFVYAFVGLLNTVGIELLEFALEEPWRGRFWVDPWVVVAGVAIGFALQYRYGARTALRAVGAREVDRATYPEVHGTVDRLAHLADVQAPTVAVAETDVPNAFTVGRRPSTATIVLTRGLLETLDDEQLEAVLAHELAHVKNRDVSVMTLAYFLPSLAYVVAIAAYYVLLGVIRAMGSFAHVDDDGAAGVAVVVVVLVVSAICTLLVSAAFWLGSFLIFRVLSQYREYAADRGAAAITGRPLALASALRTLDDGMERVPDDDLREVDGGVEALYVAPIDDYQFGDERELLSTDLFPDTHPPVDERVDRLEDLAATAER